MKGNYLDKKPCVPQKKLVMKEKVLEYKTLYSSEKKLVMKAFDLNTKNDKIGHQTEFLNQSIGIIGNFLVRQGTELSRCNTFSGGCAALVVFGRILLVGRSF